MGTDSLETTSINVPSSATGLSPDQFLQFLKHYVTPKMLIDDRDAQAQLDRLLGANFFIGSHMRDAFNIESRSAVKLNLLEHGMYRNPNPPLTLQHPNDGGISFIHETIFELLETEKQTQHYYFFEIGHPSPESAAKFLREEDLVPSGTYSTSILPDDAERLKADLGVIDDDIRRMVYNGDERLKPYQSFVDKAFDKPLMRVNKRGGKVEQFNCLTGEWEQDRNQRTYEPTIRERLAQKFTSFSLGPKKNLLLDTPRVLELPSF